MKSLHLYTKIPGYFFTGFFLLMHYAAAGQGNIKTPSQTMSAFKTVIQGNWYETGYIADLAKTRSPYRSKNKLADMVALQIDTAQASGDTLDVFAPSVHEGTDFHIIFRKGKTAHAVQTDIQTAGNRYELGYRITAKDTCLLLYRYDKKGKPLGSTVYKKAPANAESILDYMVNKTLFAGRYLATDDKGHSFAVTLSDDGAVAGLPGYSRYSISTDFVASPEDNFDQVCFDIQTDNQHCLAYRIAGNTITLYDAQKPAVIIYRLVKQ